ncbi:hypothetical protein LCGC14_0794130 [marine sediment metagenome]|uniref:Peptidase C39-like domain-containing protein n=1 Tax=marine sediment metagenome TaxID=412755 RepID=A0A0F9SBK7_9ZZZZ
MKSELKYWNDIDTHYTQENNPQEQILYKEDGKGFLEFCGSTAAVSLLHARGNKVEIICPGAWKPQPEGVLGNFFHDPRNYAEFSRLNKSIDPKEYFNNRMLGFYPYAIKQVFGVESIVEKKSVEDIDKLLSKNIGVMLWLKKPSHFIAVVKYDKEDNTIIYNDPWKKNYYPSGLKGTSGFNRKIKRIELEKNLNHYRILIGV